jgi:hypothetical protein
MNMIPSTTNIDELEAALAAGGVADCPVIHRFTPGMYVREIHIPAGTIGTSMEHRTEHPFVISKGCIHVISESEGKVVYEAPYCGITQPGTRRVLYAETDTIWTTFHATEETDVDKIGEAILEPHVNPLLPESLLNQWKLQTPILE